MAFTITLLSAIFCAHDAKTLNRRTPVSIVVTITIPFFFLLVIAFNLSAQSNTDLSLNNISPGVDDSLTLVSAIRVFGNKHTKTYVILRELPIKVGDTISKNKLPDILLQAKSQVYNTNLFIEVKIDSLVQPDSTLVINIRVKERWYIFPTPEFRIVDRSYNEWIKIYNADLERVIYGVKFVHNNFSGRRDQLRVFLLNGYARNISASYSAPYSNAKLNEGFGVSAGYTQNREVAYKLNYNNKLLNYRKEGFVRNSFNASVAYSRRKGFFKTTVIGLGASSTNLDDSILSVKYNPTFFNSQNKYQFIPDLAIAVSYANTDNINYPQKGLIYNYAVSKRGFGFTGGINNLSLSGSFARFIPHGTNWFSTIQSSALLKLPFEQAFINRRAIGFGNLNLRGLDVYIIDGVAAAVGKYTLTRKITSFNVNVPFKIKAIPYLPFKIYAKTYADVGYSYLQKKYDSRLNNRFLYTGGVGVDIVTLYDIVIKVEYSFNQLGEKSLFLRGKGGY